MGCKEGVPMSITAGCSLSFFCLVELCWDAPLLELALPCSKRCPGSFFLFFCPVDPKYQAPGSHLHLRERGKGRKKKKLTEQVSELCDY